MLTVKGLRDAGYLVRVGHFRDYYGLRYELKHEASHKVPPCPTGGETVVRVTPPEVGEPAEATAVCSIHDNYNKKLGVRIALGRAMKMLDKRGQQVRDIADFRIAAAAVRGWAGLD